MHDVNWVAVLVAGIIPLVVGMLWYGPLFGKRWLTLMETTAAEIGQDFSPGKTHGISFALSLVTAWVLAQLIAETSGSGSAMIGVHVALLALIGFVLPVAHQSVAFERRKAGLAWLNVAYNAVAMTGQAVLIAIW